MGYGHEVLNKSYTKTVDRLNKVKGLENKFIYRYDSKNNWYDIIHAINSQLQNSDKIAKIISDILYEELLSKDIFNFSFYEDKNIISESTVEFPNIENNQGYDLDEILKVNGTAILFPYIRTLISSLTSLDDSTEHVLLPAINVKSMFE
ncbi:protein-export chaperone SecB [Staphylococcus delphini]|uniref:protein-export chaperone SecB n=1 Tax=Staphylococcus delphini TaxID=53344 RepID=UPI0023B2247C|nr:protein-export chaperone SecB [Staphylococcus delphini]MDE9829222.1 protein-export chaperone SecB [Staphylococcus delphini]